MSTGEITLPDDDHDLLDLGPFESHARLYVERGWAPFPLPFRCKKPPAVGFTGDAGVDADADQIDVWMRTRRGSNIGLHVGALGVGIDVDNYDGKKGGATLADLEAELGPLPPTWTTTSRRDDDVSGIRYFRLPEARRLITELNGIEIVQRHHRYICAPPSIHPDTGETYWWLGPDGTWTMVPPHINDLPMLPPAWFEFLTNNDAARSETRAKAKKADRRPGPIDGTWSQAVDAATRYAIADLRTAFIKAIGGDRKYADKEFDKAIKSARHVAATTPAKTPKWGELGRVEYVDLEMLTTSTPPSPGVDPETGEVVAAVNLPDTFWTSRPVLEQIRAHAHHRARSADVLFGVILARVCAATPTMYHLPAIVGSRGSLNIVTACIGSAGTGKTTTREAGVEMVPFSDDRIVDNFPGGSGEGFVDAFFEIVEEQVNGKTVRVKRKTKTAVFMVIDEGQSIIETGKRSGSIIWSTIRTAWSGGVLGQGNAGTETKRIIAKGDYRCAVVANFQTAYAVDLLADAPGGTPQRVLWLSATDPSIPTTRPPRPEPFQWSPLAPRAMGDISFDCDIEVHPAVAQEIWNDSVAASRGTVQVAELDSHRNLVRLKVAALLGLLDGRPSVTEEDWALAGTVMDTSDAVRASIEAYARWKTQRSEQATQAKLVGRAAALDDSAEHRAIVSMAKALATHIHGASCTKGCTRGCVTRSTAGKHRKIATVDEAIAEAVRMGWVVADKDGALTAGGAQP